jgi:PAS domain-containing protein
MSSALGQQGTPFLEVCPMSTRHVLGSWKEVAAFMHRSVRTVQRWERDRGLPVYHLPGKRAGVYAYVDEVTAWLRSAATLHDHLDASVFLRVFAHAPDAMFLLDDERRCCEVNEAACRMLSAARSAFIGQRIDNFLAEKEDITQRWERFMHARNLRGETRFLSHGVIVLASYAACTNVVPGLHLSILREVSRIPVQIAA